MSASANPILTHHALLVAWGQFAHSIGLVQELAAVGFVSGYVSDPDKRE
jgi:hypothetical protein